MKPRRDFALVMEEHRRRLERLAKRRALVPMKQLYDRGYASVAEKLKALHVRGLKDSFGAHQLHMIQAQLVHGQGILTKNLTGVLSDASKDAQVEAIRALSIDVHRLEKVYTGAEVSLPVDEASHLATLVNSRRGALDTMHAKSMTRWGRTVFDSVHDALSLSMLTGETVEQAIDTIPEAAAAEWWQGERIVRTEMAWAYNASHSDAIAEAATELDDLMQRWVEYVDDFSGAPLDDRVDADSLAMHGQVAPVGGLFVMPQAANVSPKMWGQTWAFPPNRPQDRAVLAPWRKGWGIPAWRYLDGDKVPV